MPRLPAAHADFITEVFRYDCLTRPIYDPPSKAPQPAVGSLPIVEIAGETYFWREGLEFTYDIPGILRKFHQDGVWDVHRRATGVSIYCKTGFYQYYGNHEEGIYFAGIPGTDLVEA